MTAKSSIRHRLLRESVVCVHRLSHFQPLHFPYDYCIVYYAFVFRSRLEAVAGIAFGQKRHSARWPGFTACASIILASPTLPIRIDSVLSLEDNILTALRRISQAIDIWSRELWLDFGLTAPQLATLREILAGKNVTPVTLATALHLSQPTVTGILHRLEKRGLIKRERSTSDRRSVLAVVTTRGKDLAKRAPPLLRDRFRQELGNVSQRKQTEILSDLTASRCNDERSRNS